MVKMLENRNYAVLITSAVYASYGVYNAEQRIAQTLATAKSIRKYIPNATIFLIDSSKSEVQTEDGAAFNELIDTVDHYLDYSDDTDIQHFHKNVTNWDIGKNSMESISFLKTLNYIQRDPKLWKVINNCHRVFKISGRYHLTDNFDLSKWDNESTLGKFVFKQAQPAWIPPNDTGVTTQMQTRLWSFDAGSWLFVIQMFETIIQNMFNLINEQKYIDLEHSMSKYIPQDKLVQLPVIGLEGNIAPNGNAIVD